MSLPQVSKCRKLLKGNSKYTKPERTDVHRNTESYKELLHKMVFRHNLKSIVKGGEGYEILRFF